MEQHRVPQDISTYQFRLVGDMTLKQFAELAGGVIFAFIFYSTPLPVYLKVPLVGGCAFLGIALAFMPVQERPLDRWIIAFFKAIYAPSQFYWKKKPVLPSFLQKKFFSPLQKTEVVPAADKRRLREYLATLPVREKTPLEEKEERAMKKINQLFQEIGLAPPAVALATAPLPTIRVQPGVRVRKLGESLSGEIILSKPAKSFRQATATLKKSAGDNPLPKKRRWADPEKATIKTAHRGESKQKEEGKRPAEPKIVFEPLVAPSPINFQSPQPQTPRGKSVRFVQAAPEPLKTDTPNMLTGLVLTYEGKFIPEAIVSVIDENNLPVRALKSNPLGQFFSATPLANGRYRVEAEKEGYEFDIISLEAKGEILSPIEIRAKKLEEPKKEEVKILEF